MSPRDSILEEQRPVPSKICSLRIFAYHQVVFAEQESVDYLLHIRCSPWLVPGSLLNRNGDPEDSRKAASESSLTFLGMTISVKAQTSNAGKSVLQGSAE